MTGRTFSVGLLLVLGGVASAYAGLLAFAESDNVPSLTEDRRLSAAVLGIMGAVCLLIGFVVAFTGKPRVAREAPPQAAPVPRPEVVVVKRTQMDWGGTAPAAPDDLAARLEEVNRSLGRLKVQLGLGEISYEGYKAMAAELEGERVQIERALRQ